jgi:heptosyltransferase I
MLDFNKAGSTTNIKQITLLRLSALGDIVLVVPLVRVLQRSFPDADIVWVTSQLGYDLLKGMAGVRFVVVPKPKTLKKWWQARKILRREQSDVLLVLQASMSSNLLCPLISAPRKIGFDSVRGRDGHGFVVNERLTYKDEHFVDAYLSFAAKLGVSNLGDAKWDLPISSDDHNWAKAIVSSSTPWLAVCVTASKQERNWPVERYVAVIDYVMQHGINVVIVGSACLAEQKVVAEVVSRCGQEPINLAGKTTVSQLVALLAQVDSLLSPDTGPSHLARAVNTPVVGLYAVATPKLSGPYQAQEHCIDRYELAISKYGVAKRATFHSRVHDDRAMSLIAVSDVILVLKKLFANYLVGV